MVSKYDIIRIVKEKEKITMKRDTYDTIFIVVTVSFVILFGILAAFAIKSFAFPDASEVTGRERVELRKRIMADRQIELLKEKDKKSVGWLMSTGDDLMLDSKVVQSKRHIKDAESHDDLLAPLYTENSSLLKNDVSVIYGDDKASDFVNLKHWQDKRFFSAYDTILLSKGKNIYEIRVITAKTIPANDSLYSYSKEANINKKEFFLSAKKDSVVKDKHDFTSGGKYVILSTKSDNAEMNDVIVCKVVAINHNIQAKEILFDAGKSCLALVMAAVLVLAFNILVKNKNKGI